MQEMESLKNSLQRDYAPIPEIDESKTQTTTPQSTTPQSTTPQSMTPPETDMEIEPSHGSSLQRVPSVVLNRERSFENRLGRRSSSFYLSTDCEGEENASQWTVKQVGEWLAKHQLDEYIEKFESESIDGTALLVLTEHDLKDLQVRMGHRKKILLLLSRLEERIPMSQQIQNDSDFELDDLILRLSGLTAVDALAESNADVDSFLALLAKQME